MRTALLFLLCVGASLPLQAAPPSAPAPPPAQAPAAPPASHSRLGEMMGSLTRALQEASEQRAHPDKPGAASLDAAAATKPSVTPSAPSPDATAQAAVP